MFKEDMWFRRGWDDGFLRLIVVILFRDVDVDLYIVMYIKIVEGVCVVFLNVLNLIEIDVVIN